MTASWPALLLAAGAGLGVTLAARLAARPLVPITLPARVRAAETVSRVAAAAVPDSVVSTIVRRDPFRIGREPAPLAYDPVRTAQPPMPAAPKPALRLLGVVAGRDPTAVIEGFPGGERARVVRAGDEVAGLRVVRISVEEVKVVGMDTTWVLTVREPWK